MYGAAATDKIDFECICVQFTAFPMNYDVAIVICIMKFGRLMRDKSAIAVSNAPM